jgi:sodium transport system permease protein
MRLRLDTIAFLARTDLLMVLRDRRAVLTAILLPLLLTPLLLLASNWNLNHREKQLDRMTYRLAVTGSQAVWVHSLISATATRRASASPPTTNRAFPFIEVTNSAPTAALHRGDLQLVLEGLTTDELRAAPAAAVPTNQRPAKASVRVPKLDLDDDDDTLRHQPLAAGLPMVRILYRGDHDDSHAAFSRLQLALRQTRLAQQSDRLHAKGIPWTPAQVAAVSPLDVASGRQVAGLTLGRAFTLFALVFVLTGGAVVASDLLAGEKERGTLETLLTTAASRVEIVMAKHLVLLAVALAITLIQAANLLLYVGFRLLPLSTDFAAAISPATALLLLVLLLPVAALATSLLLLTSGYARSYQEAQLYFFPLFILCLAPALAPFLPGLPLRSAIVLVPVANLALAVKEVLVGSFDWPMLIISWLVTAAAAVWSTRFGVRLLANEKLITVADRDAVDFLGGPALFGRHVLRWFALIWAVALLVNNYIASADVRLQLLINLVGLFFGASCLMIRRYRLDPRAALALRCPRPAVWLAVVVGVPGGLLTGLGLFRLADLFFPVPRKLLEAFSQAMLPEGIAFFQILLFFTLLPAVFEEIAFRGLLLHGLHRRLRPLPLVLVVGVVFGLFHVALFRLFPTAYLGILLAAITLLTGSIFPAMLWHALSNGLGLLAAYYAVPLDELDPLNYLAGALLLSVSAYIVWRHRTPYPGLRS